MFRSARFTGRLVTLALPFLLLALPAYATASAQQQPNEKPSPGQSRFPMSAYKMPNQVVDVPVYDVYSDAGDMSVTRMKTACEGRARLDAMPNGAQFTELAKKLNLPSKAECAAFMKKVGNAGVKVTRTPAVRVPEAPQNPVFTDLASGQPQVRPSAPVAPPPPPPVTFDNNEQAPLNFNP